MREIKFRFWNEQAHKYHYRANQVMPCLENQVCGGYDYTKEGCAFEQFTGLRDKNGREIYEGDIVRVSDHLRRDFIYIVEWDQSGFVINDESRDMATECYYGDKMVIIGNIHENPGLI